MPIAIFLVCFAISVFAQDEPAKTESGRPGNFVWLQPEDYVESEELEKKSKGKFSIGLRGGLNLSYIQVNDTPNGSALYSYGSYSPTVGFQFGMVFDWTMRWDKGHFQPGLMYIQKGAKDKNGDVITLHYIEIPLLFSLKFSPLRIDIGPYHGILLNSGIFDTSPYSEYEYYFFYNDIGLSLGLGFDIGKLHIGVFYDASLFPMVVKEYGYNETFYFHNRTLGINLGVNL
jgi:hypothetical protein